MKRKTTLQEEGQTCKNVYWADRKKSDCKKRVRLEEQGDSRQQEEEDCS